MISGYLAEAMRCRTVNEFNRLHITLDNVLAPVEIDALIRGVRQRATSMPEPVALWLSRWDAMLRSNRRPVEPYQRCPIGPGVIHYVAPGPASARTQRTLVFAFTGDVNRMMMPAGLFLQHCPADRYEFVFLFDGTRSFYLQGIEGLAGTLPEAIDALGKRFPPSSFQRAISIGCSSGGLAAIWTAVALGLPRGVSVGGTTPAQIGEDMPEQGKFVEAEFEALLRAHAGALPEVLLVSGELNERDIAKAVEMSALLPATNVIVPGSARHNTLDDAWVAGTLDSLLARLLEPGIGGGA